MFYVENELIRDGFQRVSDESQLTGRSFLFDLQFSDVISFPNELISVMEQHPLITQGILVIQVIGHIHRSIPRRNRNRIIGGIHVHVQ